jgi:hypothetical protein
LHQQQPQRRFGVCVCDCVRQKQQQQSAKAAGLEEHQEESIISSMRPSDERRKALADNITLPAVSNFFPIARYYDAADVLYESIQCTKDDMTRLDLCYVYGKRYCRFVIESIPTHNYYGLSGQRNEQMKHTKQVAVVLDIMDVVADRMDAEEISRQRAIQADHERRLQEWQWQQHQQMQQMQNNNNNNQNKSDVAASALEKLNQLQGLATITPLPPPPPPRPSSTRFRLDDSEDDECDTIHGMAVNASGSVLLPPPLLPPPLQPQRHEQPPPMMVMPPPPPYAAVVGKYHPLKVSQPLALVDINKPAQQSLSELRAHYGRLYRDYTAHGRIQVVSLPTYQGRRSASTNGCTVISALCAAAHLNSPMNITNDMIEKIIDESCGPVLRTIRSKLGLGGHALIIPSDVHDHLVDHKILHQEKFRGAAGGNVLDPSHYGEFLKLLTDEPPPLPNNGGQSNHITNNTKNTKAGATFFFREHVISIVKCVDRTTGGVSYDWIDSMPSPSWHGRATRTTCADATALTTQLLHYVSGKLIDNSAASAPWDDGMADLDPRVFQGFVWGD